MIPDLIDLINGCEVIDCMMMYQLLTDYFAIYMNIIMAGVSNYLTILGCCAPRQLQTLARKWLSQKLFEKTFRVAKELNLGRYRKTDWAQWWQHNNDCFRCRQTLKLMIINNYEIGNWSKLIKQCLTSIELNGVKNLHSNEEIVWKQLTKNPNWFLCYTFKYKNLRFGTERKWRSMIWLYIHNGVPYRDSERASWRQSKIFLFDSFQL